MFDVIGGEVYHSATIQQIDKNYNITWKDGSYAKSAKNKAGSDVVTLSSANSTCMMICNVFLYGTGCSVASVAICAILCGPAAIACLAICAILWSTLCSGAAYNNCGDLCSGF